MFHAIFQVITLSVQRKLGGHRTPEALFGQATGNYQLEKVKMKREMLFFTEWACLGVG